MNEMKSTSHQSNNPFKILKMINGEDIICKILEIQYGEACEEIDIERHK